MKTPRIVTDHSARLTGWFGISLALVVAGLLFAQARCFAGGQEARQAKPPSQSVPSKQALAKKKAAETKKQKAQESGKEIITGSLIPRKVERKGAIANTPFPVIVINRQEIQR